MKINNELLNKASEFYKNGNSSKEIANLLFDGYNLKISPDAIRKRLKKIGLKLRTNREATILRKRKHIDANKLIDSYNNQIPIRELSRTLKISRKTIQKILKENCISIRNSRASLIAMNYIKEKKKISLSVGERAYLYSLVMGDLTPVRKSNFTLKLITHSTHRSFIDLLCETFKNYGITNYKETKHDKNTYRFQSHVDLESFSFLLDSKKDVMPNWINLDNFFYFLAGFIDSDGSIIIRKAGDYFQYVIRFFGQNKVLLEEIKNRLEGLGYNLSMHKNHQKGEISYNLGRCFRYNKDYFALETYKKEQTLDLLKKIPIRHPEKKAKMKLIFEIEEQGFKRWQDVEKEVKELKLKIKLAVIQKTSL